MAFTPNASWRTRLPFFYGWVIVGSSFFAVALTHGVHYSFPVFFVALLGEFGWSRASAAGVSSLYNLMTSFGGAVSGVLIERLGPARVVTAGGLLVALGFWMCSNLTELWHFYVGYGLVFGLAVAMAGWVPCVAQVNRWFGSRRGIALGIASAGIGLGTVVMVPLAQQMISSLGWRSAYLMLAIAALVGISPQSAVLQVGRPEELGTKPDGVSPSGFAPDAVQRKPRREPTIVDARWASCSWSIGMAMTTSRFWFLAAAFALSSGANQMMWVHQAAYLVDGGIDPMLAATLVGIAGLVSMPAKIMWGAVSDRIGRELTFTMGAGVSVLSFITLIAVNSLSAPWLALPFAVTFGVGYAILAPICPTAAADLFLGRRFASLFGFLSMANGIGAAFGGWLGGYIFDATGSYLWAFLLAAASLCTSVTFMWIAAPRKVRRLGRA